MPRCRRPRKTRGAAAIIQTGQRVWCPFLWTGLSGILCGGPVSSVEEPLAKDDGELCLCLDPFP
ncbi:hypothetical protein CN147_33280, partial [Sinorhizobium meliloti]